MVTVVLYAVFKAFHALRQMLERIISQNVFLLNRFKISEMILLLFNHTI